MCPASRAARGDWRPGVRDWWKFMLEGVALVLVVIAVLAGATAVMDGNPSADEPSQGTTTASVPDGEYGEKSPSPSPSAQPRADGDDAGQWWVLTVLGVVAAGIGVRLWLQRPPSVALDEPEPDADQILTDALNRLDAASTDAITVCWRQLERLAEVRGVVRGASEPAHDFARRLAAALNLPADELTTLGGLYEQAWYSSAATTYADIEAARACLQALLQAGNERRR